MPPQEIAITRAVDEKKIAKLDSQFSILAFQSFSFAVLYLCLEEFNPAIARTRYA
jgi:hypothetical protein